MDEPRTNSTFVDSLPKDIPKIPKADVRPEALVIYGIQDLNTKDIFNYFQNFGPGSIEWIDDYSCNVVWDDEHSAARALDSMGKSIETSETDIDTDDVNKLVWKAGPPCKKAKGRLLLRLSTKKDKKQPGAAKRSMFYLVHGYPGQSRGKSKHAAKRKIMQDTERARHKFSGEPDVEFIDKMEVEEEAMDVDEPAIKVVVKNDRTIESASNDVPERLRMRMHADDVNIKTEDKKSKIADRLQERLQPELENNIEKSSGDLRERLKSRRKHGFDFLDRPSLSIEIREEQS
ncbi:hypothetical protein QZH41_015215 [Actinostola sp. cb2023]|nr:hypothetical protein QZH41_015215 [Actinostola sp. cb2023]